jgi:ribosomal protein S18 acetylase RimI-like enzyme
MAIAVRPLSSDDFPVIMRLEEEIFAADGEKTLGPYYVRLCCEFFADTCLVAESHGEIAGYILCFVRGREAYCTTLAVSPRYQGGRAAVRLIVGLMESLGERVDTCWFTVKEDNTAARELHASLGAREVSVRHDFYAPGDDRIVARVDRDALEAVRARLGRLAARSARAQNADQPKVAGPAADGAAA